jgi:hypothetical protein
LSFSTTFRLALLLVAVSVSQAPAISIQTTYVFRGTCTDCNGLGTGTLVVQNYTPGTILVPANFVSFTYLSNLISFSISSSDNVYLSGIIPANLPAAANVSIYATPCCSRQLSTQAAGNASWCAGNSCGDDTGTGAIWSFPTTPGAAPTAVPALTDVTLGCLALAMAVTGGFLLKKRRSV